jgi:hypothetical protein
VTRDADGREEGCTCPVVNGRPWEPPLVVLSFHCKLEQHRVTAAANLARRGGRR